LGYPKLSPDSSVWPSRLCVIFVRIEKAQSLVGKIFGRVSAASDPCLRRPDRNFHRQGAVDEEAQRNDLNIIRQVVGGKETVRMAKAYDFSFDLDAGQQLNKAGWKP